ncbi:hypothetical protein BDN72DRAFT_279962 [Pluteus cervinus]|uniref:Uncharacterized protein n=1 Tax=Pluteus cervinus TaxID=181527 RepID=A0ACD3AEQ0_9AGAR|nr:hypothetical protein BDN72DRAFT_279962 [Pluteus cervinus]
MREASFRTAAESFEEMITEIEIPDEEDLSRVDVSGFDLGAVMLSSTPAPWDKLPREKGSIDSPLARDSISPRPSLPRSPGYSWKFPSDFRERVDALLGDRPLGKWVLGNDSPNSQSSNAGSSPSARDSGSSIGSAKCIIAASQDRDGRAWQIEITVDESDNSGDQGFQDDFVQNNSVSVFVTSPKDSTSTKEKRQGMVFPKGFSPPSFRGQEESPISSTPKGLEYSPNDSSAYSPSGDENLLLPPSQEFIEEHRSMMDETRKRAVERSMKVFYGRSIKAAVVPGTPDLNLPQELTMSPATPITPTPVGLIPGPSNQGSLKPINSRIGRPSLPGGQMGRLGAGPKARVSTTPCPPPRVSGPSAPVGKPAPLRRPQLPSARIAPVSNAKVPTARPPPLRSSNSKPVTSKLGSNKMSPRKSIATAAQRDSIQVRSFSRNGSVPSKAPQQLATRENLIPVAKGRQSLSTGPTAMGSGRQIRRVASAATGVSRKI